MPTRLPSQSPLTEPTFFILLSLKAGPLHGYAIIKEVHALSHGRITLSTGTLYTALKRLLEDGWIHRIGDQSGDLKPTGGRQRKAYSLTILGDSLLQAEVHRLEGLIHAAQTASFSGHYE
jgi:DNA-binding PadR family transcriptional regulator